MKNPSLTLFYMGGGWYTPPWWFIVRRSLVGAPNRLIFYEFVPCNIRTVLDRSFLNFFLKISKIFASTNFSKIDPKGGPFYTKIKKIKKGIFLLQIIFFLPKYEFYMFSAFIWGIKHVCSSKFFNFHFFCQILTKIIRRPKFLKFLKNFQKLTWPGPFKCLK